MGQEKIIVGFIGAGGIARSHAFALNSLKYYYNDAPDIELAAVCSATEQSRGSFAKRFGFARSCNLKDITSDEKINTVFILGPNKVHYDHFKAVLGMKAIKRIYLEKPVCSNPEEEVSIRKLVESNPSVKIQVGYQYLFTSAVREALSLWKSGKLGKPVHFDMKYYHSDYLKKEYRDNRTSRLTPAPDGGAMADLGSHAISLLIAFLGDRIRITSGLQAGHFDDVSDESDLFSQISLLDEESHAAGTLSSSRISAGTGDNLSFEIYAEKGAIRYSSASPDFYEYFSEESGLLTRQITGSNYRPVTSFPSGHVPPGWHRSMIHAHYVFLTDGSSESVIPDIEHGLQVQRLVRETADHLEKFRKLRNNRNFNIYQE
jgi:predicted dehydrogenase